MFASHALVVDCAGVKRAVYEPIQQIAANYEWQYIGGHPMAGREYSGFNHAQGDLFQNASMILTPGKDLLLETRAKLKAFFLEAGFASVRFTSAEEHDSMIAYTSQIPHILAGAYMNSPTSATHKGYSVRCICEESAFAATQGVFCRQLSGHDPCCQAERKDVDGTDDG